MSPATPPPEDTITFLFTDIEGSTKLWEQHPEAMRPALARHDTLLRHALAVNHGTVFKTMGDQFCAAFATAPPALTAALMAQRALQAEAWDPVGPLRVRMALHTGVAEERDGDYFGPALNRIARLLEVGHGGQILLTLATQELARDYLPEGASLRDLGERRLKDVTRPERIFQLVAADLPADFPPLNSLEAFPHNLPIQLTSFIGREREVAELKPLVSSHRLVTLTGTGGCGKTRLALQVAADLLARFADGVWFVELAPLADPALVPQTIATALRVREEPGRPITQTLAESLSAKQLLLMLDNCEHLVAACAQLAEILLHTCPNLRILASSREALGISGETPYRVPSLSLPDARQRPSRERLTQYEAVRLFIDRAVTALPSFTVTNENAPAVAQVCQRLDGIPLALELAAARVKVLPIEQIAERLDDRFRLLTGGSRTALPRQQTLRSLIDWSYDLLSEPERMLLRRLSVFAGGWNLEAAETICSDFGFGIWDFGLGPTKSSASLPATSSAIQNPKSQIQNTDVLDLLTSLVDKSLVAYEEPGTREAGGGHGEARYRLLETVRQYSRDRLFEAGESESVRARHRDWFVALAERAEPELWRENQAVWLERLETEHDNLRMALEWCQAEAEGAEAGIQLAGALGRFWQVRGYREEGRQHLLRLLSGAEAAGRTAVRARALDWAAVLSINAHDLAAAGSLYEEMLAIGRELDDQRVIATALNGLGEVALFQDNFGTARSFYEEGLATSRKLGNKWIIAFSLNGLGMTAERQGECGEAILFHKEALAIRRELGDRRSIAFSLSNMAHLALRQGDDGTAQPLLEESLAIWRQLGDKRLVAMTLLSQGDLARRQGNDTAAVGLYEDSLALFRELDLKPAVAHLLHGLATVAQHQGAYQRAAALFAESLALRRELGHPRDLALCLSGLAGVAGADGQPQRAARLLGAAEALLAASGAAWDPVDQEEHERYQATTRAQLDEAAFAAAWAEGQAMSLEQAMALALG